MKNVYEDEADENHINLDQVVRDMVFISHSPGDRERVVSGLVRTAKQIDEAIWIRDAEIKNAKRP
jgi:hypothetical protein